MVESLSRMTHMAGSAFAATGSTIGRARAPSSHRRAHRQGVGMRWFMVSYELQVIRLVTQWKQVRDPAASGGAIRRVSSRGWRSAPRDLTIAHACLLALYTAEPMSDKLFRGSVQD